MLSPQKRRDSERDTTTSYFSAFSPRSRNNSTIGHDTLSPLARSSSLATMDESPQHRPSNQHPLAVELHSLRTSLGKFQHVAHKTSMQLQGKALEVVMVQEEVGRLRDENRVLKDEVEALRKIDHPRDGVSSPTPGHQSINPLSELTLAHRRLCAKMDVSAEALHQTHTSLSKAEMDNERIRVELEEMTILGGKWRKRIEEGREEMENERLERRKVEEELRICKLALAESQGITPESFSETLITTDLVVDLSTTKDDIPVDQNGTTSATSTSPFIPTHTSSEPSSVSSPNSAPPLPSTPSNILLGIQGLHRLFTEFQTALVNKEGKLAELENEVTVQAMALQAEREMAQAAVREKEEMRRKLDASRADDESASKVVERYMAFSQKTAQQLHSNFQSQSTRLNQTITTLRHQLLSTQTLLNRETAKTAQLRSAIDELAEGFERETFGRRREVALRMKCLEREDRRLEAGRRWAEKVRRERSRLGGVAEAGGTLSVGGRSVGMTRSASPFLSPSKTRPKNLLHASPSSTSLASINTSVMNPYEENQHLSTLWDLLESGIELFTELDDEGLASLCKATRNGEVLDDQGARDVLVHELKESLMDELETVTRKNIGLEKQRLEWIASGTVNHEPETIATGNAKDALELSKDRDLPVPPVESEDLTAPQEHSPWIGSPLSGGLQLDLTGADTPTKARTNSQQPDDPILLLLQALQNTVGRFNTLQKQLSDCAASVSSLRTSEEDISTAYASTLQILLDGISDVIEDVRVEVEIAIADDERDLKGYQTVLKLNPDSKTVSKATQFADFTHVSVKSANFAKRLCDVENDLVGIKVAVCELQAEGPKSGLPGNADEEIVNPLLGLTLKTVRAPVPPSRATMQQRQLGNGMKRGFFGSLSRSLSGTTPVLPLSRASSVSQHSPLAGLTDAHVSPSDGIGGPFARNVQGDETNENDVDDVE